MSLIVSWDQPIFLNLVFNVCAIIMQLKGETERMFSTANGKDQDRMGLQSTSDNLIFSWWRNGSSAVTKVPLAPVSSPALSQHDAGQDLRCTGSSPRLHRSVLVKNDW